MYFRSMGSTKRTRTNPLGRRDSASVLAGNCMCARALILILIAAAKGCMWLLEQPLSSTMEYFPLFQHVLRLVPVRKFTFRMSKFVGPTAKPTILYSSNLKLLVLCLLAFLFHGVLFVKTMLEIYRHDEAYI